MKGWIIRILVVLLVILTGGYFFAKSYITKDFVVAKIEKSINSRVQIENLDVSFYGVGGSVQLENVIIAKRDSNADDKTPHDQRDPIDAGDVLIETAKFDVSIWDIFSKEILVEDIHLDVVTVNCTIDEEGDMSIEDLFGKPDKEKRKKKKKFNAKENEKFVAKINDLHLTNATINLIVEKTQLEVKGGGVNLHLLNINVNPKELEKINDAKVTLDGVFDLKSLDTGVDYGKIIADSEADVTLFNTESGDLEPDLVLTVSLDSDSYLTSSIPMVKGVWNAAKYVNKLGINVLQIPSKAKFKNDQSVKIAYKLAKSTLLEPLSIKVKDWELELLEGSWLETGSDQHEIGIKFHIGRAISGSLNGLLEKPSKLGGAVGDFLSGGEALLDNGRLALHIESTGDLSKPKVRLKNEFASPANDLIDGVLRGSKGRIRDNIENKLKEKGMDLLKGFLE